jgi:hypothetical protein
MDYQLNCTSKLTAASIYVTVNSNIPSYKMKRKRGRKIGSKEKQIHLSDQRIGPAFLESILLGKSAYSFTHHA